MTSEGEIVVYYPSPTAKKMAQRLIDMGYELKAPPDFYQLSLFRWAQAENHIGGMDYTQWEMDIPSNNKHVFRDAAIICSFQAATTVLKSKKIIVESETIIRGKNPITCYIVMADI